jgi:hypothetical protein
MLPGVYKKLFGELGWLALLPEPFPPLAVVITGRIRDEILAKYRAVPLGARLMATSLSVGTSSVAVTAAFIFRYCSFEVVSVACCANRLGCIAAKKQE